MSFFFGKLQDWVGGQGRAAEATTPKTDSARDTSDKKQTSCPPCLTLSSSIPPSKATLNLSQGSSAPLLHNGGGGTHTDWATGKTPRKLLATKTASKAAPTTGRQGVKAIQPRSPHSTRKHSSGTNLECDWTGCGVALSSPASLLRHRRIHTGVKPFKCDWAGCDAAFARKDKLGDHFRSHRGEKRFKCDWTGCKAAFSRSNNLTEHLRFHTGEKPYKCDWDGCDAAYAVAFALARHRRTHTKGVEKPHKCDWAGCGAAFKQKFHLTSHYRTHTGEKPYKCDWDGCKAAFSRSDTLSVHRRTHTGEKPYKCDWPGCGAAFIQGGHLRKHCRKHKHTGKNKKKEISSKARKKGKKAAARKAPIKAQPIKAQAEVKYEVEIILGERAEPGGGKRGREALVRWKGFSKADDSWEPVSNVVHLDLWKSFQAKQRQKLLKRKRLRSSDGNNLASESKSKKRKPVSSLKAAAADCLALLDECHSLFAEV